MFYLPALSLSDYLDAIERLMARLPWIADLLKEDTAHEKPLVPRVGWSSQLTSYIYTAEGLAQLVKRLTAEWEVAGSIPRRTNTQP